MGRRLRQSPLIDGRQIKAARAILNLSQEELAKLAGVHRNSIWRVENMTAIPRYCHSADQVIEALAPMGIAFDHEGHKSGEAMVRFKMAAPQPV